MNRVVLVGLMGAGKTTVGRRLAGRLGWTYVDNDAALPAPPGDIVAAEGLDALHAAEAAALRAALGSDDAVVAAPASAVLDASLRALLGGEQVVWLRARPETLAARVAGTPRPVAGGAGEREAGFAAVADVVVDVDARTPDEVVEEILARIPR